VAEASWDQCLAFVLAAEGGYVDDPMDPGGATNLGITLQELSIWRHTAVTKTDVQNLGKDEAAAIYRANYWNASRCSDLPAGVDLMVFDASVNMGVGRSAKFLQALVGVAVDGSIGPQTINATDAMAPADVISGLADARLQFYRGLPTFARFGAGWTARVNDAKAHALGMPA
jgi:lysozyme family protein